MEGYRNHRRRTETIQSCWTHSLLRSAAAITRNPRSEHSLVLVYAASVAYSPYIRIMFTSIRVSTHAQPVCINVRLSPSKLSAQSSPYIYSVTRHQISNLYFTCYLCARAASTTSGQATQMHRIATTTCSRSRQHSHRIAFPASFTSYGAHASNTRFGRPAAHCTPIDALFGVAQLEIGVFFGESSRR